MSERNVPASVRARLLKIAKERNQDFNLVLTRYALERLLYRISVSQHAAQFLLKGALLFDLWFDLPHRPTRDADFLGFGPADLPHLESAFKDICEIEEPDGITFDSSTVRAVDIRKEANYAGVRVTFSGSIDGARCPIQLDIGFGDAVTPAPEDVSFPVILSGFSAPQLRAYPRYTVVAEKLEALVSLGMANTRLKDFFDLWVLAKYTAFEGDTLLQAIHATFSRRGTAFPTSTPLGLTETFATDSAKQAQWSAFLRKNKLEALPLEAVVSILHDFLMPLIDSARQQKTNYSQQWNDGGPWATQ
ncbi:Nucleotidyl transferase AbiEii toxin, Type IV TA system [Duganella sp. CF458]|uniref:nucleotidyl transferase AbiEii/AbiGii toxin family protein n=1 Tax=Duganella sp. CF458 TaxID=1884368 RepID=UPI0008F1C425|nr:nucleotidyl transferase AbiEii/AbiGii toxin family protein [Duganella sp. CF458]SFF85136.1 Nucleotidyl transferase AbiEii toxin, Type IV TA system [Duganella sp. CF458]